MPVLAPLSHLVEESFDESAFLWTRWEAALDSHSRDLAGVSFWVEERLQGALAGVRAGGERALRDLALRPPDETDTQATGKAKTAVATYLLSYMMGENAVGSFFAYLAEVNASTLPAVGRGLELGATDLLLARLEATWADTDDARAVLPLRARHFLQGHVTPFVLRGLSSPLPLVQAAAFRALRHFKGNALAERELGPGLGSPHAHVRDAALETGLILGSGAAWARVVELATNPGPDRATPLLLCALLGEAAQCRHVFAAVDDPVSRADALRALGFLGTKEAMRTLLAELEDPKLGKLAAESFCVASGLSLEAEKLALPPPEEDALPPLDEDDLEADLVPNEVDLLPLPDVEGVRRWWRAREHEVFTAAPGERFLGGRPFSLERLQAILREGPARRRHVAALELAIRTLGRYQVETRAFSDLQRRQMQRFDEVRVNPAPSSRAAAARL